MEFFKVCGGRRSFSKFPRRRGSLSTVDNDSSSLAFSSRRIERLAKIEEAFCSIIDGGISMPEVDARSRAFLVLWQRSRRDIRPVGKVCKGLGRSFNY